MGSTLRPRYATYTKARKEKALQKQPHDHLSNCFSWQSISSLETYKERNHLCYSYVLSVTYECGEARKRRLINSRIRLMTASIRKYCIKCRTYCESFSPCWDTLHTLQMWCFSTIFCDSGEQRKLDSVVEPPVTLYKKGQLTKNFIISAHGYCLHIFIVLFYDLESSALYRKAWILKNEQKLSILSRKAA